MAQAAIKAATMLSAPSSPQPSASASGAVSDGVAGADGLREAVSARSATVGDVVNLLDRLALEVGNTRISLWDVCVVVMVIIGVIAAAWFASRAARRLLSHMTRLDATQQLLAEKLVSLSVWAVAILVGIDILGIDLTALAVFSGAFGLAIGFGLQKTFGNLIAGIILLLDKSIKPGDVIAITDAGGKSTIGEIRRIGIRAVSLTTRDHKEYLIPNENLMVNQVENWSYSSRNVRMQVPLSVAYGTDLAEAEALMLQAARSVERVLDVPPPTIWLDAFGDNGIQFLIHCWINDPEEGIGSVRSQVLKQAYALFMEAGIEIPFPQRDLRLRPSEELAGLIETLKALRDPAEPPASPAD